MKTIAWAGIVRTEDQYDYRDLLLGDFTDDPPGGRTSIHRWYGQLVRSDGETVALGHACPSQGARYYLPLVEEPKAALHEWLRAEALADGRWCFEHVSALAKLAFSEDGGCWTVLELRTAGYYAVASDDAATLARVEWAQKAELTEALVELGFTEGEIETAWLRSAATSQPMEVA